MTLDSKKALVKIINEDSGLLENEYQSCRNNGGDTLVLTVNNQTYSIKCNKGSDQISNQPHSTKEGNLFIEKMYTSKVVGTLLVSKKYALFKYKAY